jgi:CheY-like chemotaxis protein
MLEGKDKAAHVTERFRASLGEKLGEIALVWERWLAAPDDAEAMRSFQILVHRLTGAAPAFGLPDLGRQALRVDEQLNAWNEEVGALRAPLPDLCHAVAGSTESLLRTLGRAVREPAASPRASGMPGNAAPSLVRPPYVVLVEDDPEQAAYWRESLAANGLRVRTVVDRLALEAELVVEVPDVLLIDYWLDRQTGAEVSHWLRDTPEFSVVPKVCLTADTGPLPRQAAMDAGFVAVLRKTVTPSDLADVLRQVVVTARRR